MEKKVITEEQFRGVCKQALPHLKELIENLREIGFDGMTSITVTGDGYIALDAYGEHYCPHCGAKHDEEPDDNAWYVEKWYDEDLINALKEIGVTASEKNLERLKSECLHIFDDKSTRNEMLADKAREIFEEE